MKKIWVLALGMFALGMDTYIVAGLIPDMAKSFNKSGEEIGQGVTVFTLFFALSAPIFSTILAKYSVKKILLIALITFATSNVITMISTNYSIYMLSRSLAGLSAGIFSPIAVSSGSYLVDYKDKGKTLSFIVGGMSIGAVIGVQLGLQVSDLTSWRFAIGIITFVSIASLISIYTLLPKFKMPASPNLKERFSLFTDIKVISVISVTVCAAIASLGLYTYLSQVISEILELENITIFLTIWGVGGLIGSFGIGLIIDKFKNTKILMLIILCVLGVSIVIIPRLIKIPVLGLLPFLLWGATGWATQAPQQHILLQKHSHNGSTAVALNSSVNYLGSAIGAALGGVLLSQGVKVNALIYCAFTFVMLGACIQLVNIFKEKFTFKKEGNY
ncbi:MFS transporter [Staphylococcus shinii]|uniref:MFS transporter n=1 Tax=Staphylococcus shinii TaxID=2912228 RepID=UPI003CF421C7